MREKLRRFLPEFERVFTRAPGERLAGRRDGRLARQKGRPTSPRVPQGAPRAHRLALEPRATRVSRESGGPPHRCNAQRSDWSGAPDVHNVGPFSPTGFARSPFDCTAFRVASGPGYPHPEPARGSLGRRPSPLKVTARRVVDGGGYPHLGLLVSSIRCPPSPFEYTGPRVALSVGSSRRNTHAARPPLLPHRRHAQGFDWPRRPFSVPEPALPSGHARPFTVGNHSASSGL
ncbi:hypothetical protein DF048_18945 [Burkholderia seminalis]|nr:hypothetical protein DF048_18945 [Burkholderia seminalis]